MPEAINICQSHHIHNGTLQTSKIFQRRKTLPNHQAWWIHITLGWAETLPVASPVLWAVVASVHLQPPPLCSLPSSLREYPWWRWNSPPERDARCKLWVGRPKWPVGRIETWKCSKKYKNLDVFPGIWIIIWIIIWDLLLNLVMSLMTLCSLILRCPVKVLQSPASIVQSWRQSSTDTESWTTSSGRNLLSVQIGLSEVPIVLNSTILLAFYYATVVCGPRQHDLPREFEPHIGLELATSRHLSKVFLSSNHLVLHPFRTQLGTVSRVSAKEAKENLCTHPVEHSQIQTCHAYWPFFHRPAKDRAWFLRKELVRRETSPEHLPKVSVYKLYLQKMLQLQ